MKIIMALGLCLLSCIPVKAELSQMDIKYLFWLNTFLEKLNNHMLDESDQEKVNAGLRFCITLSGGTSYKDLTSFITQKYIDKGYSVEEATPILEYYTAVSLASVNSYCPQFKEEVEKY